MTTGGRFYREKFKPPTIQYIEEHFQEFFTFMENISPEYVTYVKEMSEKVAVYLEQTTPLVMNREQSIGAGIGDANFIPSNSVLGVPVGLIDAEFENISKVFLLIIGRAVNTFAGQNNLHRIVPAENQWQIRIDTGAYVDLGNNTKDDGQMLDTDWECMVQGAIHPFTFMFDITGQLVALDDRIGLRLHNCMALQDFLVVTVDVYLKVVWKL